MLVPNKFNPGGKEPDITFRVIAPGDDTNGSASVRLTASGNVPKL
jgi:hypothetical protein